MREVDSNRVKHRARYLLQSYPILLHFHVALMASYSLSSSEKNALDGRFRTSDALQPELVYILLVTTFNFISFTVNGAV